VGRSRHAAHVHDLGGITEDEVSLGIAWTAAGLGASNSVVGSQLSTVYRFFSSQRRWYKNLGQ